MSITHLVRKNILGLKPYSSARGSHLSGILLDANENSLGSVIEDTGKLKLNRYPDPSHGDMKNALGKYLNMNPANLFFGVGSDEIIDLLVRIFCIPGKDKAVIFEPTYGMYKVACDINDIETITIELTDKFQISPESVKQVKSIDAKLLFLCSPNNPTGNLLNKNEILKIAKTFKGIVIVDEAYVDFAKGGSVIDEIKDNENLVVMRTFSKAWGLAGIRCGYCAANEEIIKLLYNVKAPYNINKFTWNAVINAIENQKKKDKLVYQIINERTKVEQELKKIEGILEVYPTDSNFILFKCENPTEIYNQMIAKGVVIRNRTNDLNLSGCLRVSIGTPYENELFLKALKEVLCTK